MRNFSARTLEAYVARPQEKIAFVGNCPASHLARLQRRPACGRAFYLIETLAPAPVGYDAS